MTPILRKQLKTLGAATILATALLWNGDALRAQESGAGVPANPISAFLAPIFSRARENSRRSSCQSNLRQISLGLTQYHQDYDEKLPPARAWIDVTMPYLKSEPVFNCPSLAKGKRYGYALNSKIAGKAFANLTSPEQTVLVYETQILKRNAYGTGEFRANRHLNGANFAFADGHIKWFIKGKTPSFKLKP